MTLHEKWLNLPLWKAALGIFLMFILSSVLVEEVLLHTIFGFFDHVLTTMEIQSQEDLIDKKRDEKNFQVLHEKERTAWSQYAAREVKVDRELTQNRYCLQYRVLMKDKKSLQPVSHVSTDAIQIDEEWRQWKRESIEKREQEIKTAINEHQFDPAICKMDNHS